MAAKGLNDTATKISWNECNKLVFVQVIILHTDFVHVYTWNYLFLDEKSTTRRLFTSHVGAINLNQTKGYYDSKVRAGSYVSVDGAPHVF